MTSSPAAIQFYFDFSSPYSYIASEWIEALAARHGRTVKWHAILLGATFQAAGLKAPTEHPLKREYSMLDFERSARHAGVALRMPGRFPVSTQNIARLFWWLDSRDQGNGSGSGNGSASQWARQGMRAYFTRGVDLSDTGALKQLCAEFGLDPAEAEQVWTDPTWKARLKAANDAAIALGVFGAPFFIVDGEPFWGNDRRSQIEHWLDKGPF